MIQVVSTGTFRRRRGISVTSSAAAGPAFSPASLPNLSGWWKADAGTSTTTDGVAISQWSDQSGNARHLVQATGSKQPLYKAAIQNSLPVVRFDGTDDLLLYVAGAAFLTTANLTAFIVATRRGNQASGRFLSITSGAAVNDFDADSRAVLLFDDGTQYSTFRTNLARASTTVRPTLGTFNQFSIQYDGTNNSIWQDGALQTRLTPDNAAFASDRLGVGNTAGDLGSPLQIDAAEIILVAGASSTTDRQACEAYMKARWGTP